MMNFTGKNVIVTGGSRGIGKEIATQFLISGANVTITGTGSLDEEELVKDWGFKNISYQRVDFMDKRSVSKFVNWIRNQERIDILVNNAGINKVDFNVNSTISDFENLMDVNLKGPYLLSREVSRKMIACNYGRIVNITSIWGSISRSGRSLYSSTKSGLIGLTRTLAIELAPYGVLVNAVAPGFTMTELTNATNTIEEIQELERVIPIGRLAEPIEIARLVLFIASDLNTYITGQNLVIDGGYVNV